MYSPREIGFRNSLLFSLTGRNADFRSQQFLECFYLILPEVCLWVGGGGGELVQKTGGGGAGTKDACHSFGKTSGKNEISEENICKVM